jgi:hypothetical protein
MKINPWSGGLGAFLALPLLFCSSVSAQEKVSSAQSAQAIVQKAGPSAYTVARESVITGKVLSYSPSSKSAPQGAYISLQTSSGALYVHAGNPRLLAASQLNIQAGDAVGITGENMPFGNQSVFVARLIQKGNQSVAVRSRSGMPLLPTARAANGTMTTPGGAR